MLMMGKTDTADRPNIVVETVSHDSDNQYGLNGEVLMRQTKVKRIFSYLQIFFFALTYMSSWETMVSNLTTVFYNGGPRALSWGILIVFAGALAQSASLAEMSSMLPIAGAQYHWTAALAPKRHARLITWLQGWMTWFAWISTLTGVCSFTAYLVEGIVIANYPDYVPHPWHSTMIIIAILFVMSLMTAFAFWTVPWFEFLAGILHIALFVIFLAVLLGTTKEKHTAEFVFFQTSTTASGWTNDYISWNIGLLTPAWGFVGFDAAVHMSEEVRRARYAVPRAMFWSIAINGAMAYTIILAILFCMGDYNELLTSSYPLLTILVNSTGSLKIATAMCCGLLVISFAASLGTIASVSRLTWAWARDGALPKYFSYIDTTYRVPVRALWLPVLITALLSLLNIGSTAAFGAFLALSSMALYASYIIAISCMLYARVCDSSLQLGGWNLGCLGVPVNIFALLYSLYMTIFLPFPASLPVTGPTMNYAAPIFSFTVLFSVGSWWVWGRKWPGLNLGVVKLVMEQSDKDTKDLKSRRAWLVSIGQMLCTI